jgi:hypothetical protein
MTKTKQVAGKEGAKLQPQSSRNKTFKYKEINPKADKYCPLHNTNGHDAK